MFEVSRENIERTWQDCFRIALVFTLVRFPILEIYILNKLGAAQWQAVEMLPYMCRFDPNTNLNQPKPLLSIKKQK